MSSVVEGRANAINFLAQRPQATRFHHNVTIMRSLPEDLAKRWYAWFREDLERTKPEACLVNQREVAEFSDPLPEPLAFLKSFLERDYEPVRVVGDSMLYLRRDRSRPQVRPNHL